MVGDGDRQLAGQHRVDLDCRDVGTAIQQRQRQRTQAGADLKHMVVTMHSRGGNDAANGIGVVNEVLPECLSRTKVNVFRQTPYLGPPE